MHKNLGGSGNQLEYQQNNKNIIEAGTFPTAKVIGGYDFAGATSLTSDAIEWALDPNGDGATDDHVDIINISIGSEFGSPNGHKQ